MTSSSKRRGFLRAAAVGICLLHASAQASTILIGSGADSSFFLLESPNLGQRNYEIRYTHDPATPKDGAFLLQQIIASDSSVLIQAFGNDNIFVDSIRFGGVTEQGLQLPPWEPFWAHWVAGGAAGFPAAEPIAGGVWAQGSGLSGPYRIIAPGSSDALKFSDYTTSPRSAPIPEPSAAMLAACAFLIVLKRRRP
jgi:hypothetical protein